MLLPKPHENFLSELSHHASSLSLVNDKHIQVIYSTNIYWMSTYYVFDIVFSYYKKAFLVFYCVIPLI